MYADVANRQHKAVEQTGVILNEIPDDLKRFQNLFYWFIDFIDLID